MKFTYPSVVTVNDHHVDFPETTGYLVNSDEEVEKALKRIIEDYLDYAYITDLPSIKSANTLLELTNILHINDYCKRNFFDGIVYVTPLETP